MKRNIAIMTLGLGFLLGACGKNNDGGGSPPPNGGGPVGGQVSQLSHNPNECPRLNGRYRSATDGRLFWQVGLHPRHAGGLSLDVAQVGSERRRAVQFQVTGQLMAHAPRQQYVAACSQGRVVIQYYYHERDGWRPQNRNTVLTGAQGGFRLHGYDPLEVFGQSPVQDMLFQFVGGSGEIRPPRPGRPRR